MIMKTIENELRIGNYILDDFNEIHKVEHIESKKYNEWNGGDPSLVVFSKPNVDGMYSCDVVTGIPLTPEILEKAGFALASDNRPDGFLNYKLPNGICISQSWGVSDYFGLQDGDWFMGDNYTIITSLHHLQNYIHAVYGTELEINL